MADFGNSDRYYKWLDPARTTTYKHVKWPKRVGAWTADETPALCRSGWHLATHAGIGQHSRIGDVLWIAEGRGKSRAARDKIAFTSARLVSEVGTFTPIIAVRWAAECAERVLGIFEARYPKDQHPRQAIQAALKWATDPSPENANFAAYAAACAADNAAYYAAYYANAAGRGAAAYYASRATASAGRGAYAAANFATHAAYANAASADHVDRHSAACAADHAAYAAAYAADALVHGAAANAERTWQSDRLLELLEGSNP